ncbi:eEF1A lysine and N-terminal methyltransferase-like [Salvia splendens]|uniref:eEF1A lysine and N-terminal methyltransferase-like n=1 Tax=Salvia splendens TaxID=180675 RepID=UPI001C25D710|nr:eEF1A lysine and N-terminal methyltransferase-like [Salvia splendens]
MSLDPSIFETTVPSRYIRKNPRYITFTLPLPHLLLRAAVLDSPSASAPSTAAIWVPPGRESDWIFSTFSGLLQLLLSSPTPHPLSRLILLGNPPSSPNPTSFSSTSPPPPPPQNLAPLLLGLSPKSEFLGHSEIPEVPLLVYEDDVVKSSILEICNRPCVGEFLIENVELKFDDGVTEFRRRLRFKRMPNFVQSQIRIRPKKDSILDNLDDLEFELEKGVLVQPYLSPMVAGIAVIHRFLDEQSLPRALCLGVGGGALLGFLADHLNFEVDGVEEDEVVLEAARRHFGLNNEFIHLFVEDGIRYLKRIANKYDIVMVDLDSRDVMSAVSAPPVEFVEGSVLRAAREVLRDKGVLVANVIPSSKMFFERLVCGVEEIFEEVYEIDVGNEEDFVLIAAKSGVGEGWDGDGSAFLNKLKLVVSCSYIDSIRRISKIR